MIKKATVKDLFKIDTLSQENLDSSFTKEALKNMIIEDETYHVFTMEKERFIGYVIVWKSASFGQIIDIVIKEEYRGVGYGSALLKYGINYLIESGVKMISLEVKQTNKSAIALYEKQGFIKERTLKNYYKNEDGYVYIRK